MKSFSVFEIANQLLIEIESAESKGALSSLGKLADHFLQGSYKLVYCALIERHKELENARAQHERSDK